MSFCLYNEKNITRRLEDMNFIFSWQKQYFTHSLRSFVKYCFQLPLENKIHIFAPPCNILYIYRRLTKINSRYYGLSLMRTLTRGPYSVRYKGRWLYFQKTSTHTHTVWATSEGQSQGISVSSSFRGKTGSVRPASSAEGSLSLRKTRGAT